MSKKIKIGISILLLIIMISVHVSYAVDNENEEGFFKVNKEEISPEETLEMTFDISSLKYNKFKILLKSNVDSEDIYTENVLIDNNDNVISVDVDKEKISLNQIKLYYPIPKEMAIGTKIEFTAQIIVNNEIKEENQTTNTTTVTNELEIDNSTQNLENEIKQDNNTSNLKNEISENNSTLEEIVAGEITKTITVVEKKIEDNNNEVKEQNEGKNKNSNNNEQNSESNIPNIEKNNSNQEKIDSQNEEKSANNVSSQSEKISTSKIGNQNEKTFTSNAKININTNIGSSANSEPQVTYNGSNNNYLSKLEIEGIELNTSFNKENQTYFIKTNSTNTINIVATAEDSTAKINIAGNDTIQNGNNKILISVTAENGDVRYYRIFVDCEEGTDET